MAVGPAILSARNVNPEVFAVGSLHNELVKIAIVLNPVKPLAGRLHIGMTLIVIPSGIVRKGQTDISSFAQCVLRGVGSTNLNVELATADDNGAANERTKGFQNFLAELLQSGDVLWRNRVVDATSSGGSGTLEFSEREMF